MVGGVKAVGILTRPSHYVSRSFAALRAGSKRFHRLKKRARALGSPNLTPKASPSFFCFSGLKVLEGGALGPFNHCRFFEQGFPSPNSQAHPVQLWF
jgi:hypothetical protein